ncbi:MAG: hypothetical protein J6V05_01160 [Alistipes sp.]|nr:hypothetical protein [Alistipes sp.]
MAEITINDSPLSEYGAMMLAGSYNSLLTPPQLKEWVTNIPVDGDGTEYIEPGTSYVKERSVSLIFGIKGETKEDFLDKYQQFIDVLQSGIVDLYVPDLGRHYHLKYEDCTTFDHYSLLACKIAVKFIEPNPKKTE